MAMQTDPGTAPANPVLAELVRGDVVENRHRGAFCIAHADGTVLASAGAIDVPVFPRSAIKAIQALAMMEAGAPERFGFGTEALALACASHHGEPAHVAGVSAMLASMGLDEHALECGPQPPTNPQARQHLREAGARPGALHNNCSGKHAGMLSVARSLGLEHTGYGARDHGVQQRVRRAIEAVLGTDLREDHCGVDGCSIPTWAAPLASFATGFARMATGEGLSPTHAAAARRLFDAMRAHPHLVGGTGVFDTDVMTAFGDRVVVKLGAEGVFCGAIPQRGLGFALKCDDGNMQAAAAIAASLIGALVTPDDAQRAVLERFARKPVTNWRGTQVGVLRATPDAMPALQTLAP